MLAHNTYTYRFKLENLHYVFRSLKGPYSRTFESEVITPQLKKKVYKNYFYYCITLNPRGEIEIIM